MTGYWPVSCKRPLKVQNTKGFSWQLKGTEEAIVTLVTKVTVVIVVKVSTKEQ